MYEKSCASSNHIKSWKDIDFGTAEYEVKKLQMRIAKAVKENRVGKIKSLQWTLTHSFYAKAIAVKRVTENKGKRTPGVDGVCWISIHTSEKRIPTSTAQTNLHSKEKWKKETTEYSYNER